MHTKIRLGKSPTLNGIRAVIAEEDIKKGELIEAAPVILIPMNQMGKVEDTVLGWYNYEWNDKYECFVVGYGPIFNHSYHANAFFKRDFANLLMNYIAFKDINAGEEIFVNYNGDPDDQTPLPKRYTDGKL